MSLAALDDKFACLDQLPELLYAPVVTHPHGELIPRIAGVMQWREALLAGELPDPQALLWPEQTLRMAILMRLEALDICRYCHEQEDLADRVLLDILEGIQSAADYYKHKPGGFVDELAQRQNTRDQDSAFEDPDGRAQHVQAPGGDTRGNAADEPPDTSGTQSGPGAASPGSTPTTSQTTPAQQPSGHSEPDMTSPPDLSFHPSSAGMDSDDIPDTPSDAPMGPAQMTGPSIAAMTSEPIPQDIAQAELQAALVADILERRWRELLEHWQEVSELFGEWGGLLGRGWDLSQGILHRDGWREMIRCRKLIKRIPQLQTLVASLGRAQDIAGAKFRAPWAEAPSEPAFAVQPEPDHELRLPRMVMENGGIERSDDISRLLPGELALLGHPKLKKLWFARRAERLLLTYRYSGHSAQTHQIVEQPETQAPPDSRHGAPGHGPILVCLDTSGSMHGDPERIAKALVLEALRIAYRERRPCHVYSFGGPEQILEHTLDLTRGGLSKLLQFLEHSFHGGTDVVTPLMKAMDKQQTEGWHAADILLVSDGRFPVTNELIARIQQSKKSRDLRIHGLLLGNWKARALEQLCSPCHRFNDWRTLQG